MHTLKGNHQITPILKLYLSNKGNNEDIVHGLFTRPTKHVMVAK